MVFKKRFSSSRARDNTFGGDGYWRAHLEILLFVLIPKLGEVAYAIVDEDEESGSCARCSGVVGERQRDRSKDTERYGAEAKDVKQVCSIYDPWFSLFVSTGTVFLSDIERRYKGKEYEILLLKVEKGELAE